MSDIRMAAKTPHIDTMRIPRRVTAEYEDGMGQGYGMSIRRLVPYWGIGGRLNIWAWQFVAFTFTDAEEFPRCSHGAFGDIRIETGEEFRIEWCHACGAEVSRISWGS